MIRLKTTTTAVSSKDMAKIYRDEIWKIHEILQKILNNRVSQFASWFINN